MTANSSIEWTDHTFNPWTGCTKVSPGCDHCYAEIWSKRAGAKVGKWGAGAPRVRTSASTWAQPLKWNAQADAFMAANGRRQRVFCASLGDVFDNAVDPQWRTDLFELIARTPNLDWLLLTKRIGNVGNMLPVPFDFDRMYPNVWLGATIVNQEEADRDIPKLLAVPARVRFLSMEPLLGPVDLSSIDLDGHSEIFPLKGTTGCEDDDGNAASDLPAIDWVIIGGESGPGARPMHPDWARSLRDQCLAAGVPFLFKQWGEWLPWHQFSDAAGVDDPPEQTRFATMEWIYGAWEDVGKPDVWASKDGEIDDMQCVGRVGKKAAGRLLDGRSWDEVPS
jgi:protein gp37